MSDTVPKKPPHKSSFPLAAWMASVSVTTKISMANKQSLAHTSPCASWRHFFLVPVKLVAGPGRLAVTFAPLLPSLHPTSLQSMTYGTLLGRPRSKGRRSGAGLWFCWDAYLRTLKLGIIVQSCCRWKAFPSFWGHDDIKTHSEQATPRSWLLRIPGPRNKPPNLPFRNVASRSAACVSEKLTALLPCPQESSSWILQSRHAGKCGSTHETAAPLKRVAFLKYATVPLFKGAKTQIPTIQVTVRAGSSMGTVTGTCNHSSDQTHRIARNVRATSTLSTRQVGTHNHLK